MANLFSATDILQRSDEDENISYDDDDGCFSSAQLSESEGNLAVATTSIGNGDLGSKSDIETPSIYSWFHGRINRKDAEKFMREVGLMPGGYLIRESDSRPRSYVLTYVSSLTKICHYRINAVCGHYFIGQHEFSTLSDLVRYFSHNPITSENEYLIHPISPPLPVELAKRKIISLVPFCAMKDTEELSFMKGDVFIVHEDFGNGWLWVTLERTGDIGYVYGGLTEDLACSNKNPAKLIYVHTQVSRQDAFALVAQGGVGAYIVTASESSPGNFTLLVNCGRRVERFQIRKVDNTYEIGGRRFEGMHDIITRYSQLSICDDVRLTVPVSKHSPTIDNNNLDVDLYQKLRLSPLIGRNTLPDAAKYGYLNFKGRKRWKSMYFILKESDDRLYCYENEKRTKPKIVLDLFCCTLYLVHRSLFGQSFCFELIQNGFGVPMYFQASTISDYEDWISLLRPLCCGNRECPSPFSSVRTSSSSGNVNQLRRLNNLTIRIDKARNLSAKTNSELVAVISLNEAKVCRTAAVLLNESAVWDEKFVFDDIPHEMTSITVAIKSRTKKSREVKFGNFKINIACDDQFAFICDDWFDIQATGSAWKQTHLGQCHVTINYRKEVVLPLEEYRSLADLIRADDFALCHCLSSIYPDDRQKLAEALLFYYEKDAVQLIISEIKREIETSDDVRVLFRSGSFAVALMDELMLREGQSYAVSILKSALADLATSKIVLEIDQSKIEKMANLESNVAYLLKIVRSICDQIFQSARSFPIILRHVLACVKEAVSQKWAEDPLISLRAVSSFVFLRYFCLILVLPRQYLLLPEDSSTACYRNLLVIAKVLQSVANFSDVVSKRDSDMVSAALAAFSLQIRPGMILFLNTISEPMNGMSDVNVTFRRHQDPARYLATIFHICQRHTNCIKNQEAKYPAVRNLLSVLEILDCHQKRYVGGPTVSFV